MTTSTRPPRSATQSPVAYPHHVIGRPYNIATVQRPLGPIYEVRGWNPDTGEALACLGRTSVALYAERVCKRLNDDAQRWAEENEPYGL